MGLREKEVRTTLAVPECPVCKNGDMIFNKKGFSSSNWATTTEPVKYPHVCNQCGHKETYTETYPIVKYHYV